jgi:hypothetical protein
MNPAKYFSSSYATRPQYLRAAADIHASVESHVIPECRGLEGEELATDVVRLGPAGARRPLVLTSGTHGVEGICGSAAQIALLHDEPLRASLDRLNVAMGAPAIDWQQGSPRVPCARSQTYHTSCRPRRVAYRSRKCLPHRPQTARPCSRAAPSLGGDARATSYPRPLVSRILRFC